ncbi:DUF3187 family protein [bacterium]|nr:DUF3187 family protein [bacterium]
MDKPLMFGPQNTLLSMSTTFEPDTAFLLDQNDFFVSASYIVINTFAYSSNSDKTNNPSGSASEFHSNDSDGYSVFMDSEMARRPFKIYYGFSSSLEFQFTYHDFIFYPGNLDSTVEEFHKSLNIDNQGREITDKNRLDMYVHDNETGENIYIVTENSPEFVRESMTLGIKYLLFETKSSASSISFSSNYGDYYIEREVNESTSDIELEKHTDFNDHNITLRYSSIGQDFTIHAAYSVTTGKNTLLPKSPDRLFYYFLGLNWHLTDDWNVLVQALRYSSPYPKDSTSNIGEDIIEISAGLRWFFGKESVIEIGFIENQTHGEQNIDIALFSTLMFYL